MKLVHAPSSPAEAFLRHIDVRCSVETMSVTTGPRRGVCLVET